MFDDDKFMNYDDEVKEVVRRFEAMINDGASTYFDSEEFGMIIDHYTQLDEIDKARRAIDIALIQHPLDNALQVKQARLYLLENNPQEAFDILCRVNNDDEADPDFFLTLGSCLAALGKSQKAIDTYLTALPFFDEDEKCELYNAIAFEYQHLNKTDLAIEFYMKALSNYRGGMPKEQLYQDIQSCFFLDEKKDECLAFFQGLVDKNPYDSEAWAAIGDCYRLMFRYEDAIDPYEFALSINPKDLWANMHLSDIYYDLDRFKEAIDTLNEAIRNNVDTSPIRASLGDCHYRLGDLQSAETQYRKAIEKDPNSGGGWAGLGYVYSDRGESGKAIKYFEKAYQTEPFDTEHLYAIAAEYRKIDDYGHALQYLNIIQEQTPADPDAYFFIASLLGEREHVDEAVRTLKQGLQNTNNDPSLLYLLAYAYFIDDDRLNALNTLDQALSADFEGYHEFIEYDKELLANDMDIIDLIATHKTKHINSKDDTTI